MRAIVTVGLGFGDEGKGAAIDSLTRTLSADLVVRYSGGPQAGHNVQLPDGRRHTFSQFGAGTLAGARTWLGPRMIISPESMQPEADHLRELGVDDPFAHLTVHPDCLVATGYHICMNRLREMSRGDSRHGSCGQGVGETRHYWLQHGLDAIVARDLFDRNTLTAKLGLLRDRCLLSMQSLPKVNDELAVKLHAAAPAQIADDLLWASEELQLLDHMPRCETALFEGAQGVLLDEWNGFHPYTTWSTVTPFHAQEILHQHDISDATVLGLTRAITTRHGAGPFPTYCSRLTASITDLGNPTNPWQGSIRCGPLDLVLLRYAAEMSRIDGLVVSCLDQLPPSSLVCTRYGELTDIQRPQTLAEQSALTEMLEKVEPVYLETDRDGLLECLSDIAPVVGTADGPTHQHRDWYGSDFISRPQEVINEVANA